MTTTTTTTSATLSARPDQPHDTLDSSRVESSRLSAGGWSITGDGGAGEAEAEAEATLTSAAVAADELDFDFTATAADSNRQIVSTKLINRHLL